MNGGVAGPRGRRGDRTERRWARARRHPVPEVPRQQPFSKRDKCCVFAMAYYTVYSDIPTYLLRKHKCTATTSISGQKAALSYGPNLFCVFPDLLRLLPFQIAYS